MTELRERIQAHLRINGLDEEPQVHAVRGRDELSQPFRWEVDFDVPELDVDRARGTPAELTIEDVLGNPPLDVTGIVERIDVLATEVTEDRTRWRVTIVPKPYLLRWRHGFRIFQDKTVPEIVQQVFDNAGIEASYLELHLGDTYPTRVYTVQYDESEWAFICRLMEEEGIWFRWRHSSDGHVMELWDDSTIAPVLEPPDLPFVAYPASHGDSLRVWDWYGGARKAVAKITLRDYDPVHPSVDLTKMAQEGSDPFLREQYEFPGGYEDPAVGQRLARTRLQEARSRHLHARGACNVVDLGAGQRFTLTEHPSQSGEYFVVSTAIDIRLTATDAPDPLYDAGDERFERTLRVVPSSQRWRSPRVTPRPRIFGLQTAIVTGPSGEEVHCDELGRVKVQFHWDPDGQLDEHTSCWIRVGQQHTTGSVMIPRIGWEVLVEFHEGNPDRPIVLGRLFNPNYAPPYTLPAQKTLTSFRTESSPGANGINEILFDDTAGSERVALTAQHDLNVKAANNKTARIGKTGTRNVGGNRTAKVGAKQTTSVGSNLKASVKGTHDITVTANREVKVTAGTTHAVKGNLTLKVGGIEMMIVGNPVAAVIELLAAKAVNAAVGKAAEFLGHQAGRLTGPLAAALGPAGPALARAGQVAGAVAPFVGPAAALLGNTNPTVGALAMASGALSHGAAGAEGVAHVGIELAVHQVAHAAHHELMHTVEHAMHGGGEGGGHGGGGEGGGHGGAGGGGGHGGGGGGGGGGEGVGAPGAASSDGSLSGGGGGAAGSGTWNTIVGGNVTEKIGAAHALATPRGVSYAIQGSSKEMIGAARVNIVNQGIAETIGAAKVETVGITLWSSKAGINIDATGAVSIAAAVQKQKITGGHSIAAKSAAVVTTSKVNLQGTDGLTLKCGESEVAIGSSGIAIKSLKVTVDAPEILVDPPAIGP